MKITIQIEAKDYAAATQLIEDLLKTHQCFEETIQEAGFIYETTKTTGTVHAHWEA